MSHAFDEERLRTLIEHSFDAIALVEADGTVCYVSPSITRVLGYTPDEFIALGAFEAVHPDDREDAARRLAEIVHQPAGSQTVLNRVRHKDGSWRWIETVSTNQLGNPSVRAVVSNFRDITDRRRAEEALRDADRRKDEFLAMLAHELRNPLAAINNAVQLSLRAGTEEDLQWSQDVIRRQAKHLARLIDDLIDVSRITRGTIRLRKERIDLAPVIARAVESVRPLIEAKQQSLALAVAPGQTLLFADPTRMEQVLVNLLTNAAKYTEVGGHLTLATQRDDEIVVRVKDDGVGIAREMLPRIFEPFAQIDPSIDRSQNGLGIGLTLVKTLVETHGGTATAASDGPGCGSEFTIRLPSILGPVEAESPPEPGAPAATPRGLQILVVDDNRDTAAGMTKLLRASGYRVTTASDGPSALEAARAGRPDILLMDIGLPGIDGYTLAEMLRKDEGFQEAVLIAISGYGQEQDRRRSRDAGFDHHLVKPVDYERLLALLAQHRSNRPLAPVD
jgi:PAS domain S-box-containing protein